MKKTYINTIISAIAICMLTAGCGSSDQSSILYEYSSTGTTETAQAEAADITLPSTEKTDDEAAETTTTTTAAEKSTDAAETAQTQSGGTSADAASIVSTSFTGSSSGMIDTTDMFTERDLLQTPDLSEAEYITVSDGDEISITAKGVYVISGSASNCTITVDADSEDKVQIVLDGVSITNDDFPAIYVRNADKVFITTASGSENTLAVTGQFTADGDTNTDAVIFSKDDIVLNGLGTLSISSAYGNGISCKDDLKVTGGSYNIVSALDAIEANDSVVICGGSFVISSQKDGIHCENDEDNSLGYIYIADGTFDISAVSDGIQVTTVVQVDGGTMNITAREGIEGTYVQVNGGNITISASDDGINASNKSSYYNVVIEFNGGYTDITMGAGDTDGVDANGTVYVNGGTVSVNTSGNSFDYDYGAEFNGGTIIINGQEVSEIPADMMGGFGGRGGMGGMDQGGFGGRDIRGDMGGFI
ncbi:MAG: carbohydrate-binding domain-containing protein [Ruminococcus sp.]|nr:carbohydrate-binding domain-containing protein [Ruminococcus sp.]